MLTANFHRQLVSIYMHVALLCGDHSSNLFQVLPSHSALQATSMALFFTASQALQDKAKQLDAAAAAAVATADSSMSDLRIQLEAERAEARRAKMESSSLIKQYEQLVQRLRREADASESTHDVVGCPQGLCGFVCVGGGGETLMPTSDSM